MSQPFVVQCLSCGRDVTTWYRRGVPLGVDCCNRCWSRVSVAERIKITMAIRDREPGGVISEVADIIGRSIEHFQSEQENE
jgi:hypothetical protein